MIVEIEDYTYKTTEIEAVEQPISALVLESELNRNKIEIVCPNGDYTNNVTSLQVMASSYVTPSTLHNIIGKLIKVTKHNGTWFPTDTVCMKGKERLKRVDWFKPKNNSENSKTVNHAIGGGGPDPGTGNKQDTEVQKPNKDDIQP